MSYSNKFKQGFIDRVEKKLRDCEIIYNPKTKGIWFINREERYWYLEYKIETGYLWWRYEFFNQLKELFCTPDDVFDEIISEWVENKLNCEVLTTDYSIDGEAYSVKDTLNCKVKLTSGDNRFLHYQVGQTLNCEVKVIGSKSNPMIGRIEESLNCEVNRVDWGLSQHLNVEDTLNLK
jgi:hypothetical protein